MIKNTDRIKELIEILNKAAKAYYVDGTEIMSNFEYDALYDELTLLENETGIVFSNSPTQNVGYEVQTQLEKEAHETPALSLDKTKDTGVLADFLGNQTGLLSWKLDGLTIVLTYENGFLTKAVTRGNGEIGEIVTANARTFVNLPLSIPYKSKLVIRGEAVISYSDFEKINDEIADADAKYKNPRNLCSGSVRQLDSSITAQRHVRLYVFSLVSADADFNNSHKAQYVWLKNQGFDVVPFKEVRAETVAEAVEEFSKEIESFDIPSDGLVMLIDDIEYGNSLGRTAKFPRNSIAFKWKDETAETKLLDIEWSPSRTGLINPVAIFEPVELEGTTVSRASVHNISIIEGLKLGIGDILTVYKANMIIPQIARNLTESNNLEIPKVCPACGGFTVIKNDKGVKTLTCPNGDCPAKKIKLFADFVSRNQMNIDGISEETLEKFIAHGFISEFSDIYHLENHKNTIINMPGFGEKSFENIITSVNASRNTELYRVVNALGITGVGTQNAKVICSHYKDDFDKLRSAGIEELTQIDGIGEILAQNIYEYFKNENNINAVNKLIAELNLQKRDFNNDSEDSVKLSGKTFVITGSLEHYVNRDALKTEIEEMGGKVAGSVSSKTSYLINNDINSNSSKNQKAKSLGLPIITENDYITMFH